MKASVLFGSGWESDFLEVLWQDTERVFCRLWRDDDVDVRYAFVPVLSGAEHPRLESINRLVHEYQLKDYLDRAWALRPAALVRERERTMLVVDYIGGEPLDRLMGQPMEIGRFLRLAVAQSAALGRLHGQGLIHKDIKPANVIVNSTTGQVWLTGFGIASRLPRERQTPEPPEFIAGTLAYMAPEQTGRMNRSIDSRSDLYSLGVTFYQMLTGDLPFAASDPMEWVHCHIARQPASPTERVQSVPAAVSGIAMKLLSKTVEERYQTAAGVESDLRRCLSEWEERRRIQHFKLGTRDFPDRLMIPEKLYGRDQEVGILHAAFARVVSGGGPELVLVSGYSGIGKSAVVNELHKTLVPPRGLFASGKFDQYKSEIPYTTLAQAFQGLIRQLLSKSDEELRKWREAFRAALEPNGLLMVEFVPELRHVIGEQPPVPELSPQDARGRFHFVLRRFIGVFARPEHPLALFLDDLQWLDAATLDLLEDLLTCSDLQHLLLIGAYRDNEVGANHPLLRKLDIIRQAGAVLGKVVLTPLGRDDLIRLLRDSLHCDRRRCDPLAQLIHEKTSGNPFFAIQFLSMLSDEGLLVFDYAEGRWSWDLNRIRAQSYTDNVVELMVARLNRLPHETQQTLQQFACLGNNAGFDMLRTICNVTLEGLHERLWEAVRVGVIFRSDISYRFLHDRVQEAAYSLIPEEKRAEAHLRVGMLLGARTPPGKLEEAIFHIVNQLNRGGCLIVTIEDREKVAGFNLLAGRRAKRASAYISALEYLRAGRALLTDQAWQVSYDLIFSIEYLMAECEVLTADMIAAESRLSQLAQLAKSRHEFCLVTRLRITLYTALNRIDGAVDVFLDWLRRDGVAWSRHPPHGDVVREYEGIRTLIGYRQIEELIDLPLVTDPDVIDTLDVYTEVIYPALLCDEHFSSLVVCRLVILSLEHGNCDNSCYAYAWLAVFAGPHFDDHLDGLRFGQLACDLVQKRGLTRYEARTYLAVGALVIPWTKHARRGRELVRRAFDAAYRIGDLNFAAISCDVLTTICLVSGDSLAEAQTEAENGLIFMKKVGFAPMIDNCLGKLDLIRTLRGLTPIFGQPGGDRFSELEAERSLDRSKSLGDPEFFYLTRKLQARVLAGDHASAVTAAGEAQRLGQTWPTRFGTAAGDFHLYSALAHAAAWDFAAPNQREVHRSELRSHLDWLEMRAAHNPDTFESEAALVSAELARLEGQTLAAEELYERAIRRAHSEGFVHIEAVANELAARFYEARGFEKIANTYLRDARYCYLRWGADGKVRQLEQFHPRLRAETPASDATTTMLAPVEHLDLATVIKVCEAVSGEIVLEKLIDTLMRNAVEHAGANRGLLILPRGDEYVIEAEVTTNSDDVKVDLRRQSVTAGALPEAIVRYVLRTKESVLLHDAAGENQFSTDDYIREHRARSILCLPILKQTKLVGMLYLENELTRRAFTPARMAILKLLASGAAISLENARLYRDLAEREAKIRRLVDANIIGIFIWDFRGRILDANDAFLRIVDYRREDLVSNRISWRDLTPPEWREQDERELVPMLMATGSLQPFEKEYLRKGGKRVPVLVGAATFERGGNEGVAFVLDLTERKRATDALRDLQLELAHANRLATMGQLTASIAHEVNQPLTAAHNNARAALRFLGVDPPDIREVTEALLCVVNETYRAGDIVGRIRDQVKNAPPRSEDLDMNDAIEEVVALVRGELSDNRVSVQIQLGERLAPVHGDRVQLQQVILNLILNANEAMLGIDGEARELLISTESYPGGGVLVAVCDSGPGIAPEQRERIFESFYTTKPDGLGIGLSICRSIIDAHGGRLWADLRVPRGTALRFTLPNRG